MTQVDSNNEAMKQALREAFVETLHEQRELLREVIAEVPEDFALTRSFAGRTPKNACKASRGL
jgi:hypothetical protein